MFSSMQRKGTIDHFVALLGLRIHFQVFQVNEIKRFIFEGICYIKKTKIYFYAICNIFFAEITKKNFKRIFSVNLLHNFCWKNTTKNIVLTNFSVKICTKKCGFLFWRSVTKNKPRFSATKLGLKKEAEATATLANIAGFQCSTTPKLF